MLAPMASSRQDIRMTENAPTDPIDENQTIAVAFTDDDDETGLLPAFPASTVIVFGDGEDGEAPHLLMVRRATTMTFAAGAAVFPGGRVDADDHLVAARANAAALAAADAAARVAAIRETLEETGLLIGAEARPAQQAAEMRAALAAGDSFSDILSRHKVALQLDDLVPFARWRPNFAHARIFDTRFYIARLVGPRPQLVVDDGENSELFWLPAQQVLDNADAGGIHVIFPTRRNLERLAQFDSFDAAIDSTRCFPPRRITPWVADRDGQRHLCIRDDCGYPVTSEIMESAMRG